MSEPALLYAFVPGVGWLPASGGPVQTDANGNQYTTLPSSGGGTSGVSNFVAAPNAAPTIPAISEIGFWIDETNNYLEVAAKKSDGTSKYAAIGLKGQTPAHAPSLVIAASNSTSAMQAGADYVCTGTSDQSVFMTAMSALATQSPYGATLLVAPGDYYFSAAAVTPSAMFQGLRIIGSGWGTRIHLANAANDYIFTFQSSNSNGMAGGEISSMYLDCNCSNQSSGGGGINAYGAYRCKFEHLWVQNFYNEGLYLHNGPGGGYGFHNVVDKCVFEGGSNSPSGTGRGVFTNSSDENRIVHCLFQNCGRPGGPDPAGYVDYAGLNTVAQCVFVNGQVGLKFQGSENKAIGCIFDGTALDSIRLNGAANNIQNSHFYNTGYSSGAHSYSCIFIDNVQENIITGNTFTPDQTKTSGVFNNSTKGFVEFSGGPVGNTVEMNNFATDIGGGSITAPVIYNGTTNQQNNVVRFNHGFVTEAHSTATITSGNTSVVVTHGLGITPTLDQIALTLLSALGSAHYAYLSSPTSTTFTINLDANPGATVTFGWKADVGY